MDDIPVYVQAIRSVSAMPRHDAGPWCVPEEARRIARGGVLFYPCAGPDTEEAVAAFAPDVLTYWFTDITYTERNVGSIVNCERAGSVAAIGVPMPMTTRRTPDGQAYRWIDPCTWTVPMRHVRSGADIAVNWRRGFGQYALAEEFGDRSISVFMHRGDSPGECGSNTYFLARRPKRHAPLSCLFDRLREKLRDEALIVSDGSNCGIRELRAFHNRDVTSSFAMDNASGPFERWGFRWQCVGHLGRRYGPTLIWKVTRIRDAG